jgi:hypothetical protein
MEICIDFDGTCVTHEFPKVGKDIGAVPVLKKLVEAGHKLILFTMRSNRPVANETGDPTIMDVTGLFLDDAVNWFNQNDIPLHGINENPMQKNWTSSPKAYGQLYIDDAALGCPLKLAYSDNQETMFIQYVDWVKVEEMLKTIGLLS